MSQTQTQINLNKLLHNKKGIIIGLANENSIACHIAHSAYKHGAQLLFSYQNENLAKRVRRATSNLENSLYIQCDVTDDTAIKNLIDYASQQFHKIDFILHAVAFSDRHELSGKYINTTKNNFLQTMEVSCYSLTRLSYHAQEHMNTDASIVTLTFDGSNRYIPSYNCMGVAKAALESSVRYLAVDLGEKNIRINAISSGPMRTLASAAISGGSVVYKWYEQNSPLKRKLNENDVGDAAVYLFSSLANSVTGEIMYVDCGYNNIALVNK